MSRANRKFDLEKFFVALSDRNRLRLINLMGEKDSNQMESLDQIWRDYRSGLLSFIRRRVGAAGLAEDILQDVFVNAHSRMDALLRESWSEGENYQKVQFEDEQIRVTRLVCTPRKRLDVPACASGPALLIALSPARLDMIGPNGKASKLNLGLGQTGWQPTGKQRRRASSSMILW